MLKFLSMSYLFNMRPESLHFSGMIAYALVIAVFVAIIVMFSIARKRKNNVYFRVWRKLNAFAWTNVILALFLVFFEYEEVYIFSARFWPLAWVLSMIIWLLLIYKESKKIPEIKKAYEKEMEFKKYIP